MHRTALHMQLAGHVKQNVEELEDFWQSEIQRIEKYTAKDFKTFPFKRRKIKGICKLDDNTKCISREVPPLLSKATELFVMELTKRAKICQAATGKERKILSMRDMVDAILQEQQLDFLVDIIPSTVTGIEARWKNAVAGTDEPPSLIDAIPRPQSQSLEQSMPSPTRH